MTKEFTVSSAALGLTDAPLTGVTNERCADALDPRMGGNVTLTDSAFYESTEPLLLVSEALYDRLNGEAELELTVTDPAVARFWETDVGVGSFPFRVAGYYKGTCDELFMSFPAAQALILELSGQTHVDSIAFLAAGNAKLDGLAVAASVEFKTVDPLSSDNGMLYAALTVHDEQYREAVSALEQSIARSGYFLPALLLLSLGVGFFGQSARHAQRAPNLRPHALTRRSERQAVFLHPARAAFPDSACRRAYGDRVRQALSGGCLPSLPHRRLLHCSAALRPHRPHRHFERTGVRSWKF